MKLPEPTEDELVLSETLKQKIKKTISQNNGWISFSKYMEMALYEPGLGYYSLGIKRIGNTGDFVTAPEISSLFGQTIAQAILPFLLQSSFHILEIGAGSGRLAYDILSELRKQGYDLKHYDILDLSGGMKLTQQEMLKDFPQVRWINHLPESFTGVILGNEVLDAMPIHRIIKKNGKWHELGVSLIEDNFVLTDRLADSNLQNQIEAQIPDENALPEGYMTEVHLYASAFIRSLAKMQKNGQKSVAILIDYGYPASEYYLIDRNKGTFLSYYQHHFHTDPFENIGRQDMTAHIDFSMIADVAAECGIDVLCYANQAGFLLANGITNNLLQSSPEDVQTYIPEAKKMQMLLSPTEMGEVFKVMIIGNLELPSHMVLIDRSEKL